MIIVRRWRWFLALTVGVAWAMHAQPVVIHYTRDGAASFSPLAKTVHINRLVIRTDARVDQEHLRSLIRLSGTVTRADLARACFYLDQLGRFSTITVIVTPVKEGVCLTFQLRANWVLARLAIAGVWFDKDELRRRYGLAIGDIFDPEKHAHGLRALRTYYHKAGYLNVVITDTVTRDVATKSVTVALRVKTGLRCRIQQVTVVGVPASIAAEVRTYAQRSLLHRGFKKKWVKQVVTTIRELCAHAEFPCAQVTAAQTHVGRAVSLTITIKAPENSRVIVRGNRAFTTAQLIDYAIHEHGRLLTLCAPLLVQRIREYYQQQGYVFARVELHKGRWVMITQGPRVYLAGARMVGVHPSRKAVTELVTRMVRNLCATRAALETITETILAWYRARGFCDVRIDHTQIKAGASGHTLVVTVHEGRQCGLLNREATAAHDLSHTREQMAAGASVGRTVVTGLPRVSARRLLRACAYREGERLDLRALEKTFYQLRETGVFSELSVRPGVRLDPDGRVPVLMHAVADDPFELQARIGGLIGNSSRASTYVLGASAWWKNVTERADSMQVSIDATRFDRVLVASYGFSGISWVPVRCVLEAFDKKYDHVSYGMCHRTLYKAYETGGRFTAKYQGAAISGGVALSGTVLKIKMVDSAYARAICFEPLLNNRREPYVFIDPYLTADYTDDRVNPRRGGQSMVQASVGMPLVGGVDAFARLVIRQSLFFPLASRAVLALQGQLGHVFIERFCTLLPSQRFYLGGACSVRSYQGQAADPVSCYRDGQCMWCVPVGGTSMGMASAELRVALTAKIGMVFFQDYGVLKNPLCAQWCPASATGFGVRYGTVVGPLRFDVAWKAKRSAADCSPFAWFLTIGHAF